MDVWFKHDIENGIRAAVIMAVHVHLAGGSANVEYIGGILAHAHAQAALYGLSWPAMVAECKRELGADVGGLLDVATCRVLEQG